MKATLESRKNVRLNWFNQKNVPFTLKRSMKWQYSVDSALYDENNHTAYFQYIFSNINQAIPSTNIILFDGELPQAYLETTGAVGNKFFTVENLEDSLICSDRIVKREQGEEKIISKPVAAHEAHIYKEIQVHEHTDKITRKIVLKNETNKEMKLVELLFWENQNVRFKNSNPEPTKLDAPEYKWILSVPAESSQSIEINLEIKIKEIYKIEIPKEKKEASINLRKKKA